MTNWMSVAELHEVLAGLLPGGLMLRTWFHGATTVDLADALGVQPEVIEEDGLGRTRVWCGRVAGMPFSLRTSEYVDGSKFEIALPVRVRAHRQDVSVMRCLEGISPVVANCDAPYVESLPFVGAGFAVMPLRGTAPMFLSKYVADANEVADFVNANTFRCTVVPWPDGNPAWIAIGPIVNGFVSRLDVFSSEVAARRQADRWAAATGLAFEVRRELE